jgi:hypothetical protein
MKKQKNERRGTDASLDEGREKRKTKKKRRTKDEEK